MIHLKFFLLLHSGHLQCLYAGPMRIEKHAILHKALIALSEYKPTLLNTFLNVVIQIVLTQIVVDSSSVVHTLPL